MRWPEIFFKAKSTPPPEKPAPASSPAPQVPGAPSTIPGMGNTVMRAPVRATLPSTNQPKPASVSVPADVPPWVGDVKKAMEEADTLRTLTRSGGVRLIRRSGPLPPPTKTETPAPAAIPEPSTATPAIVEQPKEETPQEKPAENIATEISKAPEPATPLEKPTPAPPVPPAVPTFRRKASLAEMARMVHPPKRDELQPEPENKAAEVSVPQPETPTPESASPPPAAVVPPAFPVAVPTGSVMQEPKPEPDVVAQDEPVPEAPPAVAAVPTSSEDSSVTKEEVKPEQAPPPPTPEIKTEAETKPEPVVTEKKTEEAVSSEPPHDAKKDTTPLPKINPASTQPKPEETAVPVSIEHSRPPHSSKEKREFFLTNGERILGHILSETPDAIYLNHDTLGVLTIPRAQIARNLIEVILINGDRIVGDIVAETEDSLVVRHASLGMLTIPRAHRSVRVIEAILKDGDRILGEVLAETENFTVIRSATLGTVAVQHTQVAMLNRKIEQIQLKSLPPSPPAIENKPDT